jgi:hypothetical protein
VIPDGDRLLLDQPLRGRVGEPVDVTYDLEQASVRVPLLAGAVSTSASPSHSSAWRSDRWITAGAVRLRGSIDVDPLTSCYAAPLGGNVWGLRLQVRALGLGRTPSVVLDRGQEARGLDRARGARRTRARRPPVPDQARHLALDVDETVRSLAREIAPLPQSALACVACRSRCPSQPQPPPGPAATM